MADRQNIRYTVEERVATVVIDHPPANALNKQTLTELDGALDELLANPEVKVIIITGGGANGFCGRGRHWRDQRPRQVGKPAERAGHDRDGAGGVQQDREVPQAHHRRHQRRLPGRRVGNGDGLPHPHLPATARGWASPRSTWASSPAGAARSGCRAW